MNKSEFHFHCCFKWIQYQVIQYFQTVLIENPCYVIWNSVFACFSTKTVLHPNTNDRNHFATTLGLIVWTQVFYISMACLNKFLRFILWHISF